MYLDTYPVTLPELEDLLRSTRRLIRRFVIVKADSTVSYQKVIDVLDVVGKLDITQLGLVTSASSSSAAWPARAGTTLPRRLVAGARALAAGGFVWFVRT